MDDECHQCTEEEFTLTTMEGEKQVYKYTSCIRPQPFGEPLKCGFNDFCQDCEKRFLCATERK